MPIHSPSDEGISQSSGVIGSQPGALHRAGGLADHDHEHDPSSTPVTISIFL
jgi:hypothetical protein